MSGVEQLLLKGRAAAENLMTDTCIITRVDPDAGRGEMDPDTLKYPEPERLTIYGPDVAPHFGKCRVQIKSVVASAKDSDAGDHTTTTQQSELQLPVIGTEGVAIKDTAEILTSRNDDALVGRVLTIAALHQKSHATARRLPVTEGTA